MNELLKAVISVRTRDAVVMTSGAQDGTRASVRELDVQPLQELYYNLCDSAIKQVNLCNGDWR